MNNTMVFVHSYCLQGAEWDKRLRLTGMAQEAMTTGLRVMKYSKAKYIIVSTAYHTWNAEARLQVKRIKEYGGVKMEHVYFLKEMRNSYDEATEVSRIAKTLGADRLIIIAEKWHAPRSLAAFKDVCPDLKVEVVSFKAPWFEISYEPSMIKSLRSSMWFSWVLWNKLLGSVPARFLCTKRA